VARLGTARSEDPGDDGDSAPTATTAPGDAA